MTNAASDGEQSSSTRTPPTKTTASPKAAPRLPRDHIRLAAGPILLRVKGAYHSPVLRYAMIFRLGRSLPRFPLDPSDPETGPILPDGALTSSGNYSIEGFDFDYENSIFEYSHPLRGTRDHCYYGRLTTRNNIEVDQLNQIPAGARARIVLRPLTAGTYGMAIFAQRYVRRPRIIVARVEHYTGVRYDDGINLQVTSGPALAAIKRIGCESTVIVS